MLKMKAKGKQKRSFKDKQVIRELLQRKGKWNVADFLSRSNQTDRFAQFVAETEEDGLEEISEAGKEWANVKKNKTTK
jgi:hypothetical protein